MNDAKVASQKVAGQIPYAFALGVLLLIAWFFAAGVGA